VLDSQTDNRKLDDGEKAQKALVVYENVFEENVDSLGFAEITSSGEEIIFTKLRPRSSSRSTLMNSHEVRTPP
jgi:hypothetical protein